MTKFIIAVTLLLTAAITSGQAIIKPPIFQPEADDLQQSLKRGISDTTRIETLLRLAEFNFQKLGDEQYDLDSADIFIRNAKEINSRQISRKRDGIILLYESSLVRARGNQDSARQLANKAIVQLQAWNNDTCLVLAYLELSRCYDANKPDEATTIKNLYKTLFQRVPNLISKDQLDACLKELISFTL